MFTSFSAKKGVFLEYSKYEKKTLNVKNNSTNYLLIIFKTEKNYN